MTTTLYPDPNTAVLPSVTKPTGYLGSLWTGGTLSGTGGANCRPMTLLTPGGAAAASALTTNQNNANVPWGCQQFVGPALAGSGTISGTVDIGFVVYCSGSNPIQGAIFIGIVKADGTLRATLLSSSSFDSAFTTTGATWKTVYVLGVALSSQSFADGDRIVVELGLQRTTTVTNQLATGAGGVTAITSDHATNTSGQAFLTFSQTLTLQAPAVPALTAAVTNIETVTVSWTRDPAATTYDLNRGTAAGAETLLTSGLTANASADATATGNLLYYYTLTANGPGGSTTSDEVTAQATTLFPDLGVAADQAPTAAYGGWQGSIATYTTTNAKKLTAAAPAGPQTTIGPQGSLGSGAGTGLATFVSGPLDAQTIAGTAAFAVADTWTGATGRPELFIAVIKGDNSGLRGTVLARTFFGTARSSGGEETDYGNPFTLSSVAALAGDRLLVEVGAGSASGTVSQFYNGTTRITTSGTSIASAQARLSLSQQLVFTTPVHTETSTLALTTAFSRLLTRTAASTLTLASAAPQTLVRTVTSTLALTTTSSAAQGTIHTETSTLALTSSASRLLTRALASTLPLATTAPHSLTRAFASSLALATATAVARTRTFTTTLNLAVATSRALSRASVSTLATTRSDARTLIRTVGSTLSLSTAFSASTLGGSLFESILALSTTAPRLLLRATPATLALTTGTTRTLVRAASSTLALTTVFSKTTASAAVFTSTLALSTTDRADLVRTTASVLSLTTPGGHDLLRPAGSTLTLTSATTADLVRAAASLLALSTTARAFQPRRFTGRSQGTLVVTPEAPGTDTVAPRATGTDHVTPLA